MYKNFNLKIREKNQLKKPQTVIQLFSRSKAGTIFEYLFEKQQMRTLLTLPIILLTGILNLTAQPNIQDSNHPEREKISKDFTGDWALVSINDDQENYRVLLAIKPGHLKIGGHAGCNSFGGEVRISGQQLSVSRLVSTKRFCNHELMEKEKRLLAALHGTFTIKRDRDRLLLSDGEKMLVFQKVEEKYEDR
jgi:heat shock protein HslJ